MPEGFWGNPEGALGEQRCLRVSTKGPNEEQPDTVCFCWFILKKEGKKYKKINI